MTCASDPSSPDPAPAVMPAAASPLEDENLLPDILHRLSPLPSSLPRASLVCTSWRLVTDRRFIRRFRSHHRRSSPPPLVGFFEEVTRSLTPDISTPGGPSSLAFNPNTRSWIPRTACPSPASPSTSTTATATPTSAAATGSFSWSTRRTSTSWSSCGTPSPATSTASSSPGTWVLDDRDGTEILNRAVLRTAGADDDSDDRPFRFQVVMVGIDRKNKRQFACVYSSETGQWGDPAWVSVDSPSSPTTISLRVTGTLVGNSLYWTLVGKTAGAGILEYDLERQHLAVIPVPLNTSSDGSSFRAMRAAGGGLGIVELLDVDIQLWERKTDCDGVVSWMVTKTIELDQLLSVDREKVTIMMMGYCEDSNAVFLWTFLGIFMVELDSLKFRKLPRSFYGLVHPFTSLYIPDMGIDGGDDGAKLLLDA